MDDTNKLDSKVIQEIVRQVKAGIDNTNSLNLGFKVRYPTEVEFVSQGKEFKIIFSDYIKQ